MTPAKLTAKRHRKEMRRRPVRASRRRRNFEKSRILRKFRRLDSVQRPRIQVEQAKPEATPVVQEPPKKKGWLKRILRKEES